MKINLIEKKEVQKSNDCVEIIFAKSLDGLKDLELLELLDFKAKDESCVLLAESKKNICGL